MKGFAYMDERHKVLSAYRLEEAAKCIATAEKNSDNDDYKAAANRSYYAIFHCIRSILALDGVGFKKHSAVIGYFQKEYVKTGIFDKVFSKSIENAFEVRGRSDYEDYYVISKAEVMEQIENAKEFYNAVKSYLETRMP